ncbi:acetoin reductase family protein [Mucidula mucida]|nr:acetoin reductase family protein [Mucidula mucida]
MSHGVALVTGASQGIGRAIALRLARDGLDIALNDLAMKEEALEVLASEIEALGRKACYIVADVAIEDSLDVVVANAGVGCGPRLLLDTTAEEWDRVASVNSKGVFLCYKYGAKQMIKQGTGGRLIGASSVLGQHGSKLVSAYSASKFAVRGLTQCAASEFGQYGITANAYAPGAVDTPMLFEAGVGLGSVAAFYEQETKKSPLGIMGLPEDIASIVSFLASKQARFITGQTVDTCERRKIFFIVPPIVTVNPRLRLPLTFSDEVHGPNRIVRDA